MSPRPLPGWLRVLQVFEPLFLLAGGLLVVTGWAPLLGVVVAVVTLAVAVLTSARIASLRHED